MYTKLSKSILKSTKELKSFLVVLFIFLIVIVINYTNEYLFKELMQENNILKVNFHAIQTLIINMSLLIFGILLFYSFFKFVFSLKENLKH
jgi:ABC-type Na+ efflux pump permease subunit